MKYFTFFNNSAQVYVIEFEDFIKPDSIDLGDYISVLSEDEKDRFNRYKNEKAKFTFLTARYYLRELLSEKINKQGSCQLLKSWIATPLSEASNDVSYKLKTENGKLKDKNEACNLIIETTSSGKPYLKDYPNLFFNISHTDGLIILGIASLPIGIDVEKIDRNADEEAIVKRFFSKNEQESYLSQKREKRIYSFFIGWTRKEAILKANGAGLSSMDKIEVSFDEKALQPVLKNNTKDSYMLKDFIPVDGYTACIVLIER